MNKIWILEIEDADDWYFSTKEIAEKAVKFFCLEKDDYDLYATSMVDDDEIFRRINNLSEKERKKRGL